MKIVIAPQALKGSLSALGAAKAIEQGVQRALPKAHTTIVPIADGGDGTLEALVESTGGRMYQSNATGPLGEKVDALWGVMGDGDTAVIEMARVSGLTLVAQRKRNPRLTTTYGTGQLLWEALERGYRRIVVGLGGSATNDGGAGMAQALGAHLLDEKGHELPFGGAVLSRLATIDATGVHPAIKEATIVAATDVTNPLYGPEGASAVYGPQKGASPKMVKELDGALRHYGDMIARWLAIEVAERPGAGAAGGLGAGLMAFAGAEVCLGIDLVCEVMGFDQSLDGADLVITAEGCMDATTVYNKAPVGVARRAKTKDIPVLAMVGMLGPGYEGVYDQGIDGVMCIADCPMKSSDSNSRAAELLTEATERAIRVWRMPSHRHL